MSRLLFLLHAEDLPKLACRDSLSVNVTVQYVHWTTSSERLALNIHTKRGHTKVEVACKSQAEPIAPLLQIISRWKGLHNCNEPCTDRVVTDVQF